MGDCIIPGFTFNNGTLGSEKECQGETLCLVTPSTLDLVSIVPGWIYSGLENNNLELIPESPYEGASNVTLCVSRASWNVSFLDGM